MVAAKGWIKGGMMGLLVGVALVIASCGDGGKWAKYPATAKVPSTDTSSLTPDMQDTTDTYKIRPIYTKLTAAILDTTPDDELVRAVLDHLTLRLPEDYTQEFATVQGFSVGERAIYIIDLVEREVNKGGFEQLYYNPSGQFGIQAPDAFVRVGAARFGQAVARANAIYAADRAQIQADRSGPGGEGFAETDKAKPLAAVDQQFMDLYAQEDLHALTLAYIRSHKEEFVRN